MRLARLVDSSFIGSGGACLDPVRAPSRVSISTQRVRWLVRALLRLSLPISVFALVAGAGQASEEVTFFREIAGSSQLTIGSISYPCQTPDRKDSTVSGPTTGEWIDITSAVVNDQDPLPNGGARGTASQFSNVIYTQDGFTLDTAGAAFAVTTVAPGLFGGGCAKIIGQASGSSVSFASFHIQQPMTATISVDMLAEVLVQQGSSIASAFSQLRVCESGGSCMLDVEVRDQGAVGSPDAIAVRETLFLPAPATYTISLQANGTVTADQGPDFASQSSSDTEATWEGIVEVPEPAAGALGVAAILTIAGVRCRRARWGLRAVETEQPDPPVV